MMHGNMPEYRLAEKMKSRFSGRGAAVSGMQASTTSELMKRAQMGGDPSVNCSELDFRSGANRPRYANANRPAYMGSSAYAGPSYGYAGNNGAGVRSAREAEPSAERRKARPENGASRSMPDGTRPQNTAKKTKTVSTGAAKTTTKKPKAKTARTSGTKPKAKVRPQPVYDTGEITEVRVEGRRMTPMFAVFLVIGTMMIMSIVLSFSEIYQTTSEIAQLENTLAALQDQAAELELELEEKNDIRVIEQIATEKLGMVKEDSVQRKYISLSDGERIDIIEDENAEEETAAPGVLLSSIWSSLGNLFDYFR